MEDRQLVQNMKDAVPGAFDTLYDKYSVRLYRAAYVLAGNEADAQDILQETFVSAFLHIGELRDADKLRFWLYRILTNTAHRFFRKKAKEVPQEDMERVSNEAQLRQQTGDATEQIVRALTMTDAIRTLPVKQREAIFLFYYEDLTTREIARLLRCPETTVKSRLFKARRALRRVLLETAPVQGDRPLLT